MANRLHERARAMRFEFRVAALIAFGIFLGGLAIVALQEMTDRLGWSEGSLQALGGIGIVAALIGTIYNISNANKTLRLTQISQDNDRFFQATTQLGSESPNVRAGALYALGMLARDSPNHYEQVMNIVMQYVRGQTDKRTTRDGSIYLGSRQDIQAAIHVISERSPHPSTKQRHRVDLSGLLLQGYSFRGGWYVHCDFSGSTLVQTDFSGAVLHRASFYQAVCDGSHFEGAGLNDTNFVEAELRDAWFHDPPQRPYITTNVLGVVPPEERLEFLGEARFGEVRDTLGESGTRLRQARFHDAVLSKTNVYNTVLSECFGLTQERRDDCNTDDSTVWPDPLPTQEAMDRFPRIVRDSIIRPERQRVARSDHDLTP